MSGMADYALWHAAQGWGVFPCEPRGKRPTGRLVPHGVKDATLDPERIRAWWRVEPEGNVGVACGHSARLVVIDCDSDAALKRLQTEHGRLPRTRMVQTGRGHHFYLQSPRRLGNRSGNLPNGIDVRGEGGYVVGAGSIHASGKLYYAAVNAPVAPMPAWLLELVDLPPRPPCQRRRERVAAR